MKKIAILAILAIACTTLFSACGKKTDTKEVPEEAVAAMSVDDVLANAGQLLGDTITIEGVCSHLCSHGAMKAFIAGTADSIMLRCEAKPFIGQAFPLEMTRHAVQVKGILTEERVDSAVIEQMIAQNEALQAQAAATGDSVKDHVSGCETERVSRGQKDAVTFEDRIADYRKKIANRKEKEGKDYLSYYYLQAISYEILPD